MKKLSKNKNISAPKVISLPTGALERFDNRNICLLSLLAVLWGLQVLIAAAWIGSFFPISHEMASHYFGFARVECQPEREMNLYRLCILAIIGFQVLGIKILFRQKDPKTWTRLISRLVRVEAFWLGLEFFALFKMAVFPSLRVARYLFYTTFVLSILTKIFWKPFDQMLGQLKNWIDRYQEVPWHRWLIDIGMPLLIICMLYVPDLDGVIAKLFLEDQFVHFNSFLMAPGWVYLKGGLPGVDVYCTYGIGMSVIVAKICEWFGGMTFERVLGVEIILGSLYIVGFYVLLRCWMKNAVLAMIGTLLFMKFHIFGHVDRVDAFIWRTPSMTPLRSFFDIFLLFFLMLHARSGNKIYLWLAGIFPGISLVCETDTGVYQIAVYYAYIILMFVFSNWRVYRPQWFEAGFFFLMPWFSAVGMFSLIVGKYIFSKIFWANAWENTGLFLSGFGALPIYYNLQHGFFWPFFLACAVFLVYVFTCIKVGSLCYLNRLPREHIFVIVLCLYGLSLFHYFVNRTIATTYFAVCAPLVLIVCYWLHHFLASMETPRRRKIFLAIFGGIIFLFLGSQSFVEYPNWLNLAGISFTKEEQLMSQLSIQPKDIELITRHTRPEDKVCLISSWEINTLMAANRRPFFYYFNLIMFSRPMPFLEFGGFSAFTQERFDRTYRQLSEGKPEEVFIEKKLFLRLIPPERCQHYEQLKMLVDYLHENYVTGEEGQYLVALKRKTN